MLEGSLYFCPPVISTFNNLKELKLNCQYYGIDEVLLNLFENSPNLEVLVFRQVSGV